MTLIYIILALIALGFLIFLHELGHYWMARWVGMRVEVFSIGFGRPLLKWRLNDVDWQLGWLPFGGYVRIKGMEVSRKEREEQVDPYQIPDGFFGRPPFARILVALAGPVMNLLLALLLFTGIWMVGGRQKPFSEFTQVIGWVDPHSELYAKGVRPGDLIKRYNGKTFTGSKDLLYAPMLEKGTLQLEGEHVDYATGVHRPFSYAIKPYPAAQAPEGILTTGISSLARYLIYTGGEGKLLGLNESPMQESGIEKGDRLVWADGKLLFSLDELSNLLNARKAYLTIEREGEVLHTRQPRIIASEFQLSSAERDELIDWQYEVELKGRWQDLQLLPYALSVEGVVEGELPFIDQEVHEQLFPSAVSEPQEMPLRVGDRILAVDGTPVSKAYEVLEQIQTHRVLLMVQRQAVESMNWKGEDRLFERGFEMTAIEAIERGIGTSQERREQGSTRLLHPVEPKPFVQLVHTPEWEEQFQAKKAEIEKMRDRVKRAAMLQAVLQAQNHLVLGIGLADQQVTYNPSPLTLFKNIVLEIFRTLKAVVTGTLHMKWMSGPVGIVQVIEQGWRVGLSEALFWIGAVSMNLAILNLLPVPVLDGGYICLALWEIVTGRRLKPKTMERLIIPFVVLVIGLLIFLTFQDVMRLF